MGGFHRERKRIAARLKPRLLVGKAGVTPGVIEELDRVLESEELVKVRFLRRPPAGETDRMIAQLAKETRSELVETRGNTITLFRPHPSTPSTSGKIYKPKSGVKR